MCGIVGAVAERDVIPILLEGLQRLEYRGYDSAGVVVLNPDSELSRVRQPGKIAGLKASCESAGISGKTGIAHTRWATHGGPTENNAHPHICRQRVAVVHNGIIENHDVLRQQQQASGYDFTSDTDTEVIVHEIYKYLDEGLNLLSAVQQALPNLAGAYALGVVTIDEPGTMVVARRGSPLVIGVGIGEYFIASDISALLPVTQQFIYLEEGDVAKLTRKSLEIFNRDGQAVERVITRSELKADAADRGQYRHFMLKEIYEQPNAIAETLEGRIKNNSLLPGVFGPQEDEIFERIDSVLILACGTSLHAGMVARYWFESLAGIPCQVEVASEFRYRKPVTQANALVVTISQSGETADTLAALHEAKKRGFGPSLTICNVPESALVREADLILMTRAGPEIGVASTKAFTTQLTALMLLVIALGRRGTMDNELERDIIHQLQLLPAQVEKALALDVRIQQIAVQLAEKNHTLFLGRGTQYPIALEGALKLKEISYIHAEAYPAGELKHGPLALIDDDMPVVAVAPNNELLEKLKSNLQEVKARGGHLLVFADKDAGMTSSEDTEIVSLPHCSNITAPILYSVPLQLLAYHVAVIRGTDVDQPRNLAKSVTVE